MICRPSTRPSLLFLRWDVGWDSSRPLRILTHCTKSDSQTRTASTEPTILSPSQTRAELTLSSPRAIPRWESNPFATERKKKEPNFGAVKVFSLRRTLGNRVGLRRRSEEGGGAQALAGVSDNRASGGDREDEGGSQLRRYHPEGRNIQVCQRAG